MALELEVFVRQLTIPLSYRAIWSKLHWQNLFWGCKFSGNNLTSYLSRSQFSLSIGSHNPCRRHQILPLRELILPFQKRYFPFSSIHGAQGRINTDRVHSFLHWTHFNFFLHIIFNSPTLAPTQYS